MKKNLRDSKLRQRVNLMEKVQKNNNNNNNKRPGLLTTVRKFVGTL